jgi:Flp pilus assembly protein TadG
MLRLTEVARGSGKPSRRLRKDRGQSLVEFALALPIFLILVMGIIDFSWGLKSWISITNAAREGARYGAEHCSSGDYTNSDIEQRAIDTASGLAESNLTASVDTSSGVSCDATPNSGESLVVNVTYDYELITPLAGMLSIFGGGIPSSVTLNTSADMRIE